MDKKLSEAALEGNLNSLLEIIKEDPLILDKTIVSCISQTPLHTAAVLNHLPFVTEILRRNPELATELDSSGCSPLHLASAKGHLEVVKKLLQTDPGMSTVRNFDGRTAVHVAAMKGRVEVLAELVRVVPESTRSLTDRDETVLHLCVKRNKLEALRLLFVDHDQCKEDCYELVNLKDCDGNTVLHIAVANKQIEIVRLLLSIDGIEVNALNENNSTALDILRQSPRDLKDMEIEDLLGKSHALSANDFHLITDHHSSFPSISPQLKKQQTISNNPSQNHKHNDWLGRRRSALMVVASLIATVAFQSGLTPPGGVWQDDFQFDSNGNPVNNPHTAGTSVMAYTDTTAYGLFMIFNTIAFLASLSIILLLVSGLPMKRRRWTWVQMVVTWIAITAQVVTYFLSIQHMSPKDVNVQSTLREVLEISVLTWLILMGVVFIGNVVRMNLWILRKYGYIKRKERTSPATKDDYEDEDEDEL